MPFYIFEIKRSCVAALTGCMLLTACASGTDPNLSAEENQLRASNARFTQTVAEGAVTGAVIGGVAGALLSKNNRVEGAAIGATAGGALGGAAGYGVARNNAARTHSEADMNKAIAEAQDAAATFQKDSVSAHKITQDALAEMAALDAQYQEKKITAAEYRSKTAKYQSQSKLIQESAMQAKDEASAYRNLAGGATKQQAAMLSSTASSMTESGATLQAGASQIIQALSRVPTGA